MADIAELLKVMQEQMQLQREQMRQQEERHRQQEVSNEERHKQQLALMQQQMKDTRKARGTMVSQHQTPPFPAFDSTAELWKDYLLRFETFVNANSVPGVPDQPDQWYVQINYQLCFAARCPYHSQCHEV